MSKSLICSVLDGSEESERIFIHDTARCNGRAVLKFGLCELIKRFNEVHVVLCDICKEHWVRGLPTDVTSRVTIHSYMCGLQDTSVHLFMTKVMSAVNACQGRTALVIDSLSSLLLFLHPFLPSLSPAPPPAPAVCRWLLNMQQHHILALLHSDLHEEGMVSQVDSIATSNINITPVPANPDHYAGMAHTTHRRLSGKILKQTETYSILSNCISMETMSVLAPTKSAPAPDQVDPAANLTFDLHLSTQEKKARSEVVLPYTSAQQGEGLVTSHAGSGQIFYQPDEMDDFDDSDPDDDLEF